MVVTRHSRWASDRGDADPVLTVAAMFTSVIVSISVIAGMILLIQLGSNYTTEQTRASNLGTARQMWAQDANNASVVRVHGDDQVMFYQMPGRHPGVFLQRGDQAEDDTTCRASTWTISDGTVTNTIARYGPEAPQCGLGDDKRAAPVSTTTTITVSGLVDPQLELVNAAGRDLHYTADGDEVGLSASAASQNKSTNDRKAWWRDYEWAYTEPKTVNLTGLIDLPISGDSPLALEGTTWIRPTPAGETIYEPEPMPHAPTYNPGDVSFTVSRSTAAGKLVGGYREGIGVEVTSPATCGPYSTKYVVDWSPTTPGAKARSATGTFFGTPPTIDVAGIPNGATGTVLVTASCPASVQTGDDSRAAHDYTQPLPGPTLSAATTKASPHKHALSWPAVSSLPDVQYTVGNKTGGGWSVLDQTQPNPTGSTHMNVDWEVGSAYGLHYDYRVKASLPGSKTAPDSDWSNTASLFTDWPKVTGVGWDDPAPSNTEVTTKITTNTSCPAGTHPLYRQRSRTDKGSWGPWASWSKTRSETTLLPPGSQGDFHGQVRCGYGTVRYSPASATINYSWVQKITTAPDAPTVTVSNTGWSKTVDASWASPANTCPAGTSLEYQHRYRTHTNGHTSAWSSWGAWSATTHISPTLHQGAKLQVQAKARCVSPYTYDTAPTGVHPKQKTNGPASQAGSKTFTRPIKKPSGPATISHDAKGSATPKDNRFTWTAVSCPAHTHAEYRRAINGKKYDGWATSRHQNVAADYGTKYTPTVTVRCSSDYTHSPTTSKTGTPWTTNVPAPDAPQLSLNPGIITSGSSTSVVVDGAYCPGNLTTRYTVTGPNGSYNGSFSDPYSWDQTGTYTYKATAYCSGKNASGPASPPTYETITVEDPQPPIPPGGGGVSGEITLCNADVASKTIGVRYPGSVGAASYEYELRYIDDVTGTWDKHTDVRQSPSADIIVTFYASHGYTSTKQRVRVWAIGYNGLRSQAGMSPIY